ncbi:AAA family ATPase [Pontibacter arcticus]|uniref:ATP-binding cassette family protein n=1 Tax=Pontibacter arcticus TaxID=2080288 RepID=A0A364RDT7_9BACT|nr:SbcC/MukB-like Walker B domain-containing protein [Pontibacter arcticus]RAU82510.1 ATP-binding cassette family protein [Pontibacter arcticus]
MKILAVRFQNLNSLKGQHEIRFDQSPLADAGLFAITGPTGAGKTTILDAITVGLYGMAHRHNNEKPLELMTRHTSESTSEVEFEANGKRYRSKWQIRRSRGKAEGKMQAVHMELCDLEDDKPFDLKPSQVPDKVAEICGLDYSQFLRSVMLSQGDFARFLKANANERSSLLEKITDTGIYSDISRFAYEKARAERQKRDDLARLLQDCKLLPEEDRLAYEQSITDLTQQESILQQEITALQEQMQWLQQVAQLQDKARQHTAALQEQEQKLEQLKPDFQKLQQHERANQYVPELTEIKHAHGRLSDVENQLGLLTNQIPVLETELEQAGLIAIEAGKAHQQQEEAVQNLEPLLDKVIKLDHQKQSVQETYQKERTAYVAFEANIKQDEKLLESKQTELEALKLEATTLKNWLADNQRLQDLKENLPEFRQMVRDLQEVEGQILRTQQEIKELDTQSQEDKNALQQLAQNQEQQHLQQALLTSQKQEKVTQLQTILSTRTINELQQQAQEQPLAVARTERALDLTKQHAVLQQKQETLQQQLVTYDLEKAQLTDQLEINNQTLNAASERLIDLQKLVTLQQRIQEFEQARHTLKPSEPCPLCGSEHHPYADENYTLTLSEDEQKRDAQQQLVLTLQQEFQALQLQLNTLTQKHQLATETLSETQASSTVLLDNFTQISLPESITIADVAMLAAMLQQQNDVHGQLMQALEQARAGSKEIESINQQLQELRELQIQAQAKYNQLQQSEKYTATQLQKLAAKLGDDQEQQRNHSEMAASFVANYGLLYTAEKRMQLPLQLEQLALAYTQKQQALDEMREKYITLNQEVKNLDINLKEKKQALQAQQESIKSAHAQLLALKEERSTLFGEKDPQQERQAAQHVLRLLATQAEEARANQLRKQQQLQACKQRHQECSTAQQQNKSVLDNLTEGLLLVLNQQGIETIEALSMMLLERDEADRLANQKAHTEKNLTELRKSLSDVQQELKITQAKNLTNAGSDELQKLYLSQQEQQHELIGQRARYKQLLEQDTAQREKNKELAGQLQNQQLTCNRWSQLSDLIGSADGNKFSRFAQGLTLARLVELANKHLAKLNDRYRILKSPTEDLELTMVDTYQAETIRPMNTLSGGESFLVSLALALGLSDLAGRRTQINSLFIDEGFGTLDAETLDAAISTLENLQAGGKMIGIISHVEALKERISTQIKVQKIHGGISKVTVVTA